MKSLIWFKKDLRVEDNEALFQGLKDGPFICLYVYEPDQCQAEEFAAWHLEFINESLADLEQSLTSYGINLYRLKGMMPDVLSYMYERFPFDQLLSHEETGHELSFARDRRVKTWCQSRGVKWQEFKQFGVVRRLANRDGWARKWHQMMNAPTPPLPRDFSPAKIELNSSSICAPELGLYEADLSKRQRGGSKAAHETLKSFFELRGENYRSEMSSPVTAFDSCSRLSPYITYGTISLRHIVQTLKERQDYQRTRGEKNWRGSLSSFGSRLRWHCHFIQKLEDEPAIEFENMNRAFDGLRPSEPNERLFEAWKNGETGYPFIDACMRALKVHGWINFRMRAMLASFSAYHLWLHWREPAKFLGKYFLDFEPGIHYSQFQMQSGTTGINSVRIYSPIKQVQDHDPEGVFIRQYLPELKDLPSQYLPFPEKLPPIDQADLGFKPGRDYPLPIVDHIFVYAEAKKRIFQWKKRPEVKTQAQQVYQKHGSRGKPRSPKAR